MNDKTSSDQRAPANARVQVDNDRVRVTEYQFAPGAETGWHRHGWDLSLIHI